MPKTSTLASRHATVLAVGAERASRDHGRAGTIKAPAAGPEVNFLPVPLSMKSIPRCTIIGGMVQKPSRL